MRLESALLLHYMRSAHCMKSWTYLCFVYPGATDLERWYLTCARSMVPVIVPSIWYYEVLASCGAGHAIQLILVRQGMKDAVVGVSRATRRYLLEGQGLMYYVLLSTHPRSSPIRLNIRNASFDASPTSPSSHLMHHHSSLIHSHSHSFSHHSHSHSSSYHSHSSHSLLYHSHLHSHLSAYHSYYHGDPSVHLT
jgi:hypothetical protein